MTGFANYDQIINALTTGKGQLIFFQKASITSVAAFWYRLWTAAGFPGAGSEPSPALQGAVPTKDAAGALPIKNPISPAILHMLTFGAGGPALGSLMIYDRIWHVGGINLNINTLQSFTGTLAPTRHSDGIGNQLLIEITTVSGSTTTTITVNYTNTADQAKQATVTLPASAQPVNRVWFLSLASGDLGVKSVQSIQLSAATGAAGVANLVMFNSAETAVVPWAANQWTERDLVLQMANLPRILDDACLALMVLASATSTNVITGRLQLAEN
jgi:hypothetical protein